MALTQKITLTHFRVNNDNSILHNGSHTTPFGVVLMVVVEGLAVAAGAITATDMSSSIHLPPVPFIILS